MGKFYTPPFPTYQTPHRRRKEEVSSMSLFSTQPHTDTDTSSSILLSAASLWAAHEIGDISSIDSGCSDIGFSGGGGDFGGAGASGEF